MIAARAEEDEALAVRLLRSEGYYDAVADLGDRAAARPAGAAAGHDHRRRRASATISARSRSPAPDTEPPGMAREFLPLEPGEPIRAVDVEAAEANVLLRLPQEGYPFPELGLRDIVLDPETHARRLYAAARARARARASPASPPRATSPSTPSHVGVLARFERGDLYDRRKVDDLREAMVSTRLFSTVSAEPVLTGETGRGRHPICQHPRPPGCRARPARSTPAPATAPARASALEGAWEHRNLFPPEGALRVAAIAGTQEQNLCGPLPPQQLGQARPRLAAPVRGRRAAISRPSRAIRPGSTGWSSRESTPIWQKRWTYAYGAELLATNENRTGNAADLALRRLFHRRADRPARLRPLEQPARSDQRLPPARPGQSGGLARATAPTSTSAT